MNQESPRAVILVVDDIATNIDVIKSILAKEYFIQAALDGRMALKIIEKKKPDLVLLDIMMPEIDGYEVCRRLKANPNTASIPVIFVTARSDENDEIKGFDLGAVDYITKPVKAPILRARVKTHLRQRQMQKELEEKNDALEDFARLRDQVEHITRHDLKTPLSLIIGAPPVIADNTTLTEDERFLCKAIEQAGHNMLHMINSSLDLYKMEMGSYTLQADQIDLIAILRKVLTEVCAAQEAQGKKVLLRMQGKEVQDGDTFSVLAEEMLCYPIFSNLILNAFQASPDGATVTVDLERENTQASVSITNQGEVPASICDTFFDKFVTEGKSSGTGLGTYSAKLCVETQHGTITMESLPDEQTRVTVCLPLSK